MKGHIRIMHEGKWKGICGIGWGLREAGVICRQLGLGYPKEALSTTRYGTYTYLLRFIWQPSQLIHSDTVCKGSLSSLDGVQI